MSKAKILLLILLLLSSKNLFSQKVIINGDKTYLSNRVIIKLKEVPQKVMGKVNLPVSLESKLLSYKVEKVAERYIFKTNSGNPLQNIFTVDYALDIDPLLLAAKLQKTDGVLWAEPHYVYSIEYVPNDPSYSNQWNLEKINAEQAWELSRGDKSIIIGIVDSGVDWDHPDLAANIWENTDETPGNGVDDDNNGFIDDVRGWDFGGLTGTPDNNPMEDKPDHGTHVAGIAAAISDNNVGISSIGFNCTVMPVKVSRDNNRDQYGNPYIIFGSEGIVYAAENGAKIINCSFGGSGFSNNDQEVVQFALSKGALIVAAAGNTGTSNNHYPSGYDGVLSVAATNTTDKKSSYSNYGKLIDICAPGDNVYSTWQNNTYSNLSGTSMSSPLVSGLAGLVAAKFPTYTPLQIAEQIRVNSDNIDAGNGSYSNLLGKGRVNAYKALNISDAKSVRAYSIKFSDEQPAGDGDNIFEADETITATIKFRNFLQPTQNLAITLESRNDFSTIDNPVYNGGSLNSLDSSETKFRIAIKSNVPKNEKLTLILNYSDGSYSDFQWLEVTVNPSYYTQHTDLISLTITSKGTLGYNDYPTNKQGEGFIYKDKSHLFEGAFMVGTAADKVSDAARSANQDVQSNDFEEVQPFVLRIPGAIADEQGLGIFNDTKANTPLGIETHLNSYSYSDFPYNKFIILKYRLKNTGQNNLSNVYAGLFFDWDMVDGQGDRANYNNDGNFGYAYHPAGDLNTYVGSVLLSEGNTGYYAILNSDENSPERGFGIYDGFTDSERYYAMSKGVTKPESGPGDVSFVIAGGPYNLNAGDSVDVAFSVAAGDSLEDLANSVSLSRQNYQQILTDVAPENSAQIYKFNLEQNYPNPFNPVTKIKYNIPEGTHRGEFLHVTLKVYDILGRQVAVLVNEQKSAGSYSVDFNASNLPAGRQGLASGIYLYELRAGQDYVSSKKMIILK